MTWEYSEDNLIEQTAIDIFFDRLGWDTQLATMVRIIEKAEYKKLILSSEFIENEPKTKIPVSG